MSEIKTFPAPRIELPKPTEDKWDRERLAFLQLRPELLKTHLGKFVAIHEEKLVDSDNDKLELAARVYRRFGYVPIYVGMVTDRQPAIVRIPTARTVREGPAR